MATCIATPTNTAPRIQLGHSYPLPSAARHKLKLVPNQAAALPKQEPALDLQSPMNRYLAGKSRREYLAGQPIFSKGDPANAVFYIHSGKVKLTVVSMNGKEAVIAHLSAASFFGEASLAGEPLRSSTAYALESDRKSGRYA